MFYIFDFSVDPPELFVLAERMGSDFLVSEALAEHFVRYIRQFVLRQKSGRGPFLAERVGTVNSQRQIRAPNGKLVYRLRFSIFPLRPQIFSLGFFVFPFPLESIFSWAPVRRSSGPPHARWTSPRKG